MIVWDIQALARRLFCHVPAILRHALLQIECVRRGVKPALLVCVSADQAAACLAFMTGKGLACVVRDFRSTMKAFAQFGPPERLRFAKVRRVRIYAAQSFGTARQIAAHDDQRRFDELGIMLGYPGCCVDSAHARTQAQTAHDAEARVDLRAPALHATTNLQYECNTWLDESAIAGDAPASIIAHYPCTFSCAESAATGRNMLDVCADEWPEWAATLGELLRSPIIYWPGSDWPAQYWDDSCGLSMIGSFVQGGPNGLVLLSRFRGVPLGRGVTPAGTIPEDVSSAYVTARNVFLETRTGSLVAMPEEVTGLTYVLEWRNQAIHIVGEQPLSTLGNGSSLKDHSPNRSSVVILS